MRVTFSIVFGHLCLTAGHVLSADESSDRGSAGLEKINRRIVAEPEYESTPRYVLLAFGEDARSLLWLVEDGRALYVDRNGNGDLTDDGPPVEPSDERQLGTIGRRYEFVVGDLEFPDGTRHSELLLKRWGDDHSEDGTAVTITVNGVTPMYAGWSPLSAESPEKARIIHFGGPLEPIKLRGKSFTLKSRPQRLSVALINRGLGERAHARLNYKAVPDTVVPVVEITWPTASGEPLKTTHQLTERCCYWEFYTESFRVPDGVVEGTAAVVVSLPGYVNPFGYRTTEMSVPVQVMPEE